MKFDIVSLFGIRQTPFDVLNSLAAHRTFHSYLVYIYLSERVVYIVLGHYCEIDWYFTNQKYCFRISKCQCVDGTITNDRILIFGHLLNQGISSFLIYAQTQYPKIPTRMLISEITMNSHHKKNLSTLVYYLLVLRLMSISNHLTCLFGHSSNQ